MRLIQGPFSPAFAAWIHSICPKLSQLSYLGSLPELEPGTLCVQSMSSPTEPWTHL